MMGSVPTLFGFISLDCPWHYRTWSEAGQGRSAENEYPTMTLDDIAALGPDVTRLLDPAGAFVLAWVTGPGLFEQGAMFESWGLKYITIAFSWLKQTSVSREWFQGNGHYTRANTELCLLYGWGDYTKYDGDSALCQVVVDPVVEGKTRSLWNVLEEVGGEPLFPPIVFPVEQHSAKPVEFYRRAEMLSNHLNQNRLELFARLRWPGWYATGLDLDGLDIRDALRQFSEGEYTPKYDRLCAPAVTTKRGKGSKISDEQMSLFEEEF